ncbi:RloB domain-containing protein [Marinifilum fragile]
MARSNRRVQGRKRGQGNKTIYVLVDGETEQIYLHQLKQFENLKAISIKPDLPKKKSLRDQYELIKEEAKHYDNAIWLVDFDEILKHEREFRGKGKSPLTEFNEYYTELDALENVDVLVNTPCLEYWYLLHLKNTRKFYASYSAFEKDLNAKPITGYNKSRKYYVARPGIYAKLKPNMLNAYNRAKQLGNYDPKNPQQAKAEIYRLFELLGIIMK